MLLVWADPFAAWFATACNIEDGRPVFLDAFAAVVWGAVPAPGPRYMASIVGRRAAPKGVDKKSVGKSKEKQDESNNDDDVSSNNAPLMKDGIVPPVRNPMQSFVNELQLKSGSKIRYWMVERDDEST